MEPETSGLLIVGIVCLILGREIRLELRKIVKKQPQHESPPFQVPPRKPVQPEYLYTGAAGHFFMHAGQSHGKHEVN
jgi:hypothetical protein